MSSSQSGLDSAHIDTSVRIQDDLYRHYNGTWLREAQIPADRSSDGAFYALRDQSEAHVREIIESATGSGEAQQIGDLYRSFMDTDSIEKLGTSVLSDDLAAINAITDASQFIATMSRLEIGGLGGVFGAGIYTDAMDSTTNIVYLGQSGISLPDESYYREEQYAPIRDAFLEHVAQMFALVGIAGGRDKAQKILSLETQIASAHWDQVKERDATLTYNKHSLAQLKAISVGFDWDLYLKAGEIPVRAF